MSEWAEQECRIACKKENPDFDFNSDEFDYGCSCYKSALKAYKSLMEDEHSGMSFSFTKNILIRLMEGLPLTPITDDDFFNEDGSPIRELESNEYLKRCGLKSDLQCTRMSSLFRKETLDGKVTYRDIDRSYFIDIENPSDTYQSNDKFLDEMFPITMPYMPEKGKYKIYAQTFLADEKNGDFDTRGILYLITPDGTRVNVNKYYTERDGEWVEIDFNEYGRLLKKRIDKLNEKIAHELIWTLISNSASEDVIAKREEAYNKRNDYLKRKDLEGLSKLCLFFDCPDNFKFNTFSMHQALCKGNLDCCGISEEPELMKIADYLKRILDGLGVE